MKQRVSKRMSMRESLSSFKIFSLNKIIKNTSAQKNFGMIILIIL
jgi:hypothetical protein